MKKKTKRYEKELGKSHRQLEREENQAETRKTDGAKRRSSGNGSKKNYNHRQPLEFQLCSRHRMKFCKRFPLTQEAKKIFGRVIMKIIPPEVRNHPDMLPYISVYRDTKRNTMILRVDSVKYEENLVTDENGNVKLVSDTEFAAKRFKPARNANAAESR